MRAPRRDGHCVAVIASLAVALSLPRAGTAQNDPDPMEEAKKDLDRLQGNWQAVSWQRDGAAEPVGKRFDKLCIKGNRMILTCENGRQFKPKFRLDASATPRLIDFTFTQGNRKGLTWEGVYQVKKDTFTLCINVTADAKRRPIDLSSKRGSGYRLVVFERKTP